MIIRQATIHDASGILNIYRPIIEETAISFESEVPSIEEIQGRITAYNQRHLWLVCEDNGQIIGYAYGSPHRSRFAYQWSVETSVYVDRRFRESGIGKALYACLLKALELQGYKTALAGITIPNDASKTFHEKMGFKYIGEFTNVGYKFGKWHSTIWLQKPLGEYSEDLNPALLFSEIKNSQKWTSEKERVLKFILDRRPNQGLIRD